MRISKSTRQVVVWIAAYFCLVGSLYYVIFVVSSNKKNHNLSETAFSEVKESAAQHFDSLRDIDIAEFRSQQNERPLNPYLGMPRGLGCYTETIYT